MHTGQRQQKNGSTQASAAGRRAEVRQDSAHQALLSSKLTPKVNIQPKLSIGQPGDKHEQEADRVAEHVVSQPLQRTPSFDQPATAKPQTQRPPAITPVIQQQAEETAREEKQPLPGPVEEKVPKSEETATISAQMDELRIIRDRIYGRINMIDDIKKEMSVAKRHILDQLRSVRSFHEIAYKRVQMVLSGAVEAERIREEAATETLELVLFVVIGLAWQKYVKPLVNILGLSHIANETFCEFAKFGAKGLLELQHPVTKPGARTLDQGIGLSSEAAIANWFEIPEQVIQGWKEIEWLQEKNALTTLKEIKTTKFIAALGAEPYKKAIEEHVISSIEGIRTIMEGWRAYDKGMPSKKKISEAIVGLQELQKAKLLDFGPFGEEREVKKQTIEQNIWIAWISGLSQAKLSLLDILEINQYLNEVGVFDRLKLDYRPASTDWFLPPYSNKQKNAIKARADSEMDSVRWEHQRQLGAIRMGISTVFK